MSQSHLVGCILGTAIGDAIGLPYEGLSAPRAARLLGEPDRHHLVFGRGMVSDDTEHTCMVAQALIASGGGVDAFRRDLGWRLRWWLLGLPAGIGLATLRSILRLWIGSSPERSGVFSAGNGAAMRVAILGAAVDDGGTLCELVRAASRITHTDPKAEHGALAVALAAQTARRHRTALADRYLECLRRALAGPGDELLALLVRAADAAREGRSTPEFAESLGLAQRVSGYVLHSVPVAIHAWLAHPQDYRAAVAAVVRCGGDTDTTAAIVGGIVGTAVGKAGIPEEWLAGLVEWPRTVRWMELLAEQLAASLGSGSPRRAIGLPWWKIAPRNLLFLLIVLFHGFRRLLPPY